MPKTSSKPVDAKEIAQMADRGQDVSGHFTNQFTVIRSAEQTIDVACAAPLSKEFTTKPKPRASAARK